MSRRPQPARRILLQLDSGQQLSEKELTSFLNSISGVSFATSIVQAKDIACCLRVQKMARQLFLPSLQVHMCGVLGLLMYLEGYFKSALQLAERGAKLCTELGTGGHMFAKLIESVSRPSESQQIQQLLLTLRSSKEQDPFFNRPIFSVLTQKSWKAEFQQWFRSEPLIDRVAILRGRGGRMSRARVVVNFSLWSDRWSLGSGFRKYASSSCSAPLQPLARQRSSRSSCSW